MSFSSDLQKFANKTGESIEKVLQITAISILPAVVQRTPVKTGRARANWLYTTTSPDTATVESGADTAYLDTGSSSKIAHKIKAGLSHILSNNLPYIEALESGRPGKGSTQAPSGMVKVTALEFEAALKRAARKNAAAKHRFDL